MVLLCVEGVATRRGFRGGDLTRLSYLRKMAWLMPRLQRAVPYLGYLLVVGEKPAALQGGAAAQAEEVAEGLSPERMSGNTWTSKRSAPSRLTSTNSLRASARPCRARTVSNSSRCSPRGNTAWKR